MKATVHFIILWCKILPITVCPRISSFCNPKSDEIEYSSSFWQRFEPRDLACVKAMLALRYASDKFHYVAICLCQHTRDSPISENVWWVLGRIGLLTWKVKN